MSQVRPGGSGRVRNPLGLDPKVLGSIGVGWTYPNDRTLGRGSPPGGVGETRWSSQSNATVIRWFRFCHRRRLSVWRTLFLLPLKDTDYGRGVSVLEGRTVRDWALTPGTRLYQGVEHLLVTEVLQLLPPEHHVDSLFLFLSRTPSLSPMVERRGQVSGDFLTLLHTWSPGRVVVHLPLPQDPELQEVGRLVSLVEDEGVEVTLVEEVVTTLETSHPISCPYSTRMETDRWEGRGRVELGL